MSILINYYRKKHNNNRHNNSNNKSHCEEAQKKKRRHTQRSVAGCIVCVLLFNLIPDEREIIIPQTISLQQPHLHPEPPFPSLFPPFPSSASSSTGALLMTFIESTLKLIRIQQTAGICLLQLLLCSLPRPSTDMPLSCTHTDTHTCCAWQLD